MIMKQRYDAKKTYGKRVMTERKIADTFLKLLEERELEKITVQDVCDRAGIHRTTFYKHFGSMYEVTEFFISYLVENMMQPIGSPDFNNGASYIASFLKKNTIAFSNLSRTKYKDALYDAISEALYDFLRKIIDVVHPKYLGDVRLDWLITYNTAGIMALAFVWMEENSSENEMRECLETMISLMLGKAGEIDDNDTKIKASMVKTTNTKQKMVDAMKKVAPAKKAPAKKAPAKKAPAKKAPAKKAPAKKPAAKKTSTKKK